MWVITLLCNINISWSGHKKLNFSNIQTKIIYTPINFIFCSIHPLKIYYNSSKTTSCFPSTPLLLFFSFLFSFSPFQPLFYPTHRITWTYKITNINSKWNLKNKKKERERRKKKNIRKNKKKKIK